MDRLLRTGLAFALLVCMGRVAIAQETTQGGTPAALELSLGAIAEQVEGSAVRALVKYGDRISEEDRLVSATGSTFYEITRKVQFDVTDKGTFGGVFLRYGFKAYRVPIIEKTLENGKTIKLSDSSGWMHVFPVTVGLDADRRFKNRDVLLEGGYVPFKGDAQVSCFKLGGNPIVGIVGQVGHSTRDPATASADQPSTLRRIKGELLMDFKLGCFRSRKSAGESSDSEDGSLLTKFAADLANWRILIETRAWRDFGLHETFRRSALTIRIPTTKDAFVDLKREVGQEPPTFAKGAQFGAYLTVQF